MSKKQELERIPTDIVKNNTHQQQEKELIEKIVTNGDHTQVPAGPGHSYTSRLYYNIGS